jgi:putative salt-induced outer membrane protein YdiY
LLNLTNRIVLPALALGVLILAGCRSAGKGEAEATATVSRLEVAELLGRPPAPQDREEKPRDEYVDVVTLDNGDKLTGVLEGYDGSRLEIETRHSDLIRVRWKRVVTIETRFPVRVELITGDVVTGVLTMDDEGILTIESAELEEPFEIHRSQVSRMDRRKSRLEGDVNLSANLNDGGANTSSVMFKFDFWWKGRSGTATVKGNATYNTSQGESTEDSLYGQVRYDYLILAGTYVFGSFEIDHDEFQAIRLRTVWTGGGGYEILQKNWIELTGDLGVSYTTEEDVDQVTNRYPGGRAGLRFKWDLGADFKLRDVFTFYPNFQTGNAWRLRNELSLEHTVHKGWTINTGIITRYQNQPPPDALRASSTFYLGLGYTF